jgi:hypothetical protein
MLPFKIRFKNKLEIIPSPKIAKIMKIISEDELLYCMYFGSLSIFQKVTLKIFPEKDQTTNF